MVGRADALAAVRAAWTTAASGQRAKGTCLAITGEPGIGKSRLVAALRDLAREEGGVVLDVAGSLRYDNSGLFPFRRLLEDDAGIERLDDGSRRLERLSQLTAAVGLEAKLPFLAALLGLDPSAGYAAPELDARQLREEIEGAVLAYVTARTAGQPALLIVEDLHWIDAATRDLVMQLIRQDAPLRLIVLSSRQASDAPRGDATTHLELAPLGDAERLALVHAIVGDQLDELALRDVAEQSDGVPLYAEELARAATLGNQVTDRGSDAVPDVLYGSLVARLNVSPQVMEVAATAATIGRELDPGLLARACPLPPAERSDALRVLLAERILEPAPDQPDQLRFRHDLLRAVVDDLQPPSHRRELHRAVADALVADDVDPEALDWLLVATHLEVAEEAERAAAAFGRASASARQRGDLPEARLLLTRAVDLIDASSGVSPELEIDLRLRRGFLAVSLEGNASASTKVDYERCLEFALETTHAGALLSTLGCIGSYHAARAEFDRSREVLGGLVRLQGPLQPFGEFFAMAGHSLCDMYCGDTTVGLQRAEQALAMQAEFGAAAYGSWWFTPLDPSVITHTMVAIGHFSVGNVAGTEERFRASRAAADALPFPNGPFSLAGHLSLEVWIASELSDDANVDEALGQIAAISAKYGFDQWSIVAATAGQLWEGLKAARAGDGEAASRCAHALGGHLMMWKLVDQWVFLTYYLTLQGVLHAAGGETELARACYEEAMELTARTGMGFYEVETRRHAAALISDVDEREMALREALAIAQRQGTAIFELRTALDLERLTGDLEPARTALARISPEARIAVVNEARALVAEGGRA
jgi:tetratricopeptide (TPR) repeat protein